MFLSFSILVLIVAVNFYSGLVISNSSGVSFRELIQIAFANTENPECYGNEQCPDGMKCENGTCVWKEYKTLVNCTFEDYCQLNHTWMVCSAYKTICTTDVGMEECPADGTSDICRCDPCGGVPVIP